MATHSSILTWRISWTEVPGGLQFMGSQRVRPDWVTNTGVFLLGFIMHGTLCGSWTWLAISFSILGKFSTIISSKIFFSSVTQSCPTLCTSGFDYFLFHVGKIFNYNLFKIFSYPFFFCFLCLVFVSLISMCLDVFLLGFILYGTLCLLDLIDYFLFHVG